MSPMQWCDYPHPCTPTIPLPWQLSLKLSWDSGRWQWDTGAVRRVVLGSTHVACHQRHALSMPVLRAGVFRPHDVGPVLPRDLSQLLRLCATSRYLCILGLHSVAQGSWKELLQAASSLLPWLPCAKVPHAGCTAALCNLGRTGQNSLLCFCSQ